MTAALRLEIHWAASHVEPLYVQVCEVFGREVAERLAEHYTQMPPSSTRVLTHGDATPQQRLGLPPNGAFVGLVDFERAHVNSPIQDLLPLVAGTTRHFHHPTVEATIDLYVRSCPPHRRGIDRRRPGNAAVGAGSSQRVVGRGIRHLPGRDPHVRLVERRQRIGVLLAALVDL